MSVKLGVRVRVSVNHNLYPNVTLKQNSLKRDRPRPRPPAQTPNPTLPRVLLTPLSKSRAEAEELNQSQSMGTCIVIGLSFNFCHRFRSGKRRSHKRSRRKMETFWFFGLRLCRAYDFAYESDFSFPQGHKQPANSRRISGRRFSPSYFSEGEKRRPEMRLLFAG